MQEELLQRLQSEFKKAADEWFSSEKIQKEMTAEVNNYLRDFYDRTPMCDGFKVECTPGPTDYSMIVGITAINPNPAMRRVFEECDQPE